MQTPDSDALRRDLTLEKAAEALGALGKNDNVVATADTPRGLSGANTLGLRATENSVRLGQRGTGTYDERVAALEAGLKLGQLDGVTTAIDDTWDDETGKIRSLAMRHYKDRGSRHTTEPVAPDDPLAPQLPLLYVSTGVPAPPYHIMGAEAFDKFMHSEFAQRLQGADGQYMMGVSDVMNIEALKAVRAPSDRARRRRAARARGSLACAS